LNLELKEMKSLFSILEQFFEIDFIWKLHTTN
jgi:hypothetical protein